jgi:hypothetical protein
MQIPKPSFIEQVAALFGSATMDMKKIGKESLSGDYSKIIVAGNLTIIWNHLRINDQQLNVSDEYSIILILQY